MPRDGEDGTEYVLVRGALYRGRARDVGQGPPLDMPGPVIVLQLASAFHEGMTATDTAKAMAKVLMPRLLLPGAWTTGAL
jgi:hypothetical protein